MEKSTYLEAKRRGDVSIIYEYYKEHFTPSQHGPLLSFQDFVNSIRMFGPFVINNMMVKAVEYYDDKFHITVLKDKDGNIIKEY